MSKLETTDWSQLPASLQQMDPQLRQQAFTHRSLRAQKVKQTATNERLEFLGDAVLELIVSQFLYHQYPHWDEGKLTRYRAALVRTESLAYAANEINLGNYLRTNVVEADQASDTLPSYLADTFEAVLGALYLDQGYDACQQFVKNYLLPFENRFITAKDAKDAKSKLQEKMQSLGFEAPIYRTIKQEGPDHATIFEVEVEIPQKGNAAGQGTSKQRAQQAAAKQALIKYFPDQG